MINYTIQDNIRFRRICEKRLKRSVGLHWTCNWCNGWIPPRKCTNAPYRNVRGVGFERMSRTTLYVSHVEYGVLGIYWSKYGLYNYKNGLVPFVKPIPRVEVTSLCAVANTYITLGKFWYINQRSFFGSSKVIKWSYTRRPSACMDSNGRLCSIKYKCIDQRKRPGLVSQISYSP